MINLSSRTSIETATLLKWTIPNFDVAYVTDASQSITFGGNIYTNIGSLMNIGTTTSELKATSSSVSVGLSGIPTGAITTLLAQEIKGSSIEIYRAIYDPTTHALLTLSGGNPVLKYKGIVTNYDITDSIDTDALLATSNITLTCSSFTEILNVKISGRRTSSTDFPGELSMSRVQALSNSNFNFGVK